MANYYRHNSLLRYFVFGLISLLSNNALAQANPVQVVPVSSTPMSTTTFNHTRNITFQARNAANGGLYYQRAVTFSRAQIAGATRSRIVGAAAGAAAISAVMLGIGYALDELTGQIYSDQGTTGLPQQAGTYWCISGSYCAGTVAESVSQYAAYLAANEPNYYGGHRSGSQITDANFNVVSYKYAVMNKYCSCWVENAFTATRYGPEQAAIPNYSPGAELGTQPTQATDQQIYDAVSSSPAAMNEVFTHPNGNHAVVEPMPAVMNDLASQYRQDTNQPLPEGATDPANTTTDNTTEPAATQWPTFCSWATKACELVDWFREDDDDSGDGDPPEIDSGMILPVTWTSGFGSGSCPSERTVSVGPSSFTYSYTPWCQFAAMLRTIVLAACAFTAVFIIHGRPK